MGTTTLRFLGAGNSHSAQLGNSSAVLRLPNGRNLMIDMGPTAYREYKNTYGGYPDAIFITHGHLDHIGGLENLFYDAYFSHTTTIKLFVPASLVPHLQDRLGSLANMVAEGGANFWDAFQLCPVSGSFWFEDYRFTVFENRHHLPGFSFGLSLPGVFLFSGDTKPIPEIINAIASQGETIFHDLSFSTQPSHTFFDELKQYKPSQIARFVCYHLSSPECFEKCEQAGIAYAKPGQTFVLRGA